MSYYIYNFESEFDFNKLIIGKQIKMDNISRYYLYYLDGTPKDLFIKLPSIRLIYSYKNNKFNQIKLPIYPLYDTTIKFLSFLKSLNKIIKEHISNECIQNKVLSDIIEKKDKIKTIKLNIPIDFKIHTNSEYTNIKELKPNGELNGIINLPYIWENDTNFGLSLYISKLNYIPKIEVINCDFIDFNEVVVQNNNKNVDYYNKNKNNNQNIKKHEDVIEKPKLTISPNILLDKLHKLNKIKLSEN
jgi:hypothetical protein